MPRRAWLGLVFVGVAGTAAAQPVGSEFRVNGVTLGFQYEPAVAADAQGNFVVVWASDNVDGSSTAIVGRRYDPLGNPLGNEFVVNTFTTGYQAQPSVAMNSAGAFVVVWNSVDQLGAEGEIVGQRFDAAGATVGVEFLVNATTGGNQRDPDVAIGPGGEFVVAWTNYVSGYYFVTGQLHDSDGNAVGIEFPVSDVLGEQSLPAVAMLPAGRFVVAWDRQPDQGDPSSGVAARLFAADGNPAGASFAVNTQTTNAQTRPDVAADAAGNFVVVWEGWLQDEAPSPNPGIFGQRFEADGDRSGGEFRVNTYTTYGQGRPAVAREANGDFVVTWDSERGGYEDVFAQRFAASGAKIGAEFQVNTFTTYDQLKAVLASLAQGQFVVAWTSYGQDGYSAGVYAQRFSDPIFRDGFE